MTMQDNRYERSECLGEGSFGKVYKAKKVGGSDQAFAVKYISTFGREKKDLNNVRNEITILGRLDHPNIIQFIDSYDIEGYIVVVTECAKQELFKTLTAAGSFPEDRVYRLSCQLCAAVYYLHANRILHRDLKPENILLMEDDTLKVCDFGFARAMGESYYATTIKCTPVYMAPEIAREDCVRYNEKVDIWAVGCIIYEMHVGQPPFFHKSSIFLVRLILDQKVDWPNNMPDDMKDLLECMLIKDPRQRRSWPDILSHPWFKGGIKVSPEVLALESPYTKPDVAAQEVEKYHTMVRIRGCGGTMPSEDARGKGDEVDIGEMDMVILIDVQGTDGAPPQCSENT